MRATGVVSARLRPAAAAAAAASGDFCTILDRARGASAPAASFVVGLEHEYRVSDGDQRLDFRTLVHGLGLGQPRLDPADPFAYRLTSGAKLTCDKEEAEIAIAPVPIAPGFAAIAESTARDELSRLRGRLSPSVRLEGSSTHISIAVPDDRVDEVAALYTSRFAPGFILLVDGSSSPGLAIRPRPGRLELCGEFLDGTLLRAAVAFAAGGVAACTQAVIRGDHLLLPPALEVRLLRVVDRYGWYVDARPLVDRMQGRAATWQRSDGGTIGAERHLELAWLAARGALGACAGAADLAVVSHLIAGDLPGAPDTNRLPVTDAVPPKHGSAMVSDLLRPRQRERFALAPVMVTWDVHVFVVAASRGRLAFATVPVDRVAAFLGAADGGLLDDVLERYLSAEPSGRELTQRVQALQPGLYDALPTRVALLAAERAAAPIPKGLLPRRRSVRRTIGHAVAAVHEAHRATAVRLAHRGAGQ